MREPEQWHLSKSIQIPHIVTTIVALLAAVMFIIDIKSESRESNLQQDGEIKTIKLRIDINEKHAATDRAEMLQKFKAIDDKLEILMQRTAPRR